MALKPIILPNFYRAGALKQLIGGGLLTAQPVRVAMPGGFANGGPPAPPPPDSPPVNTVAPVITSSATPAVEGGVLTITSQGTWSGYPAPVFDHQEWYRDGVLIVGETGSSYTTTGDDVDTTVTAKVYFTNSSATVGAESNGIAVTSGGGTDTSLSVFTVEGQSTTNGGTVNLDNSYVGDVIGDLTVVTTPTDPMATVGPKSITPSPLVLGDNILSFDVTASNGITVAPYSVTLHVLGTPFATDVTDITGWSATGGNIELVDGTAYVDTPETVTALSLPNTGAGTGSLDFSVFPGLQTLVVNGMSFTTANVDGLSELAELSIIGTALTAIPDLTALVALEVLDLRDLASLVSPLPPDVSACSGLQTLVLQNSPITSTPSLIGLTDLVSINFNNSPVTSPPDILGLLNLTGISLSGCAISDPDDIDDFLLALQDLVVNGGGQDNGTCDISGGTNATPSATGIAAALDLINNHGWHIAPFAAPANTVPPVIEADGDPVVPTVNLNVTSEGTWTGFPTPTLSEVDWLSDGVDTGQTGSMYTCQVTDVGQTVTANVLYENGIGDPVGAQSNGIPVVAP